LPNADKTRIKLLKTKSIKTDRIDQQIAIGDFRKTPSGLLSLAMKIKPQNTNRNPANIAAK
jgi:hypothetical protein